MKVKAKLGLVALLACCSMVGMGFAGWTISQDPSALTASVTGTVTAESVLSCSAPEIGDLHYSSLGFTSEEGTAFSYTTTFTVTYTITSGGYDGEATLTATMGYSSSVAPASNLFTAGNEFLSVSVAVNDDPMSEVGTQSTGTTYVITATVDFSDEAATQTVNITYTLDFTDLSNYTTYFFNVFSQADAPQFTFNATLEGE